LQSEKVPNENRTQYFNAASVDQSMIYNNRAH